MVDENHFKIPSPESVDDDEEFQILSLFQEHELAYLKSDSAIVKAMNSIADSFDKTKKSPLKWKILGVPKRCESELIELMNPHAHLDVIPARMPSAEHLNDVLGQSNLVLVHPYSVHYVNLTLAAMSAAIPVIVPARSLSHELIRVHTPEYEESIVVDMTKTNDLENRMSEFLCKYEITLKRAKDIKGVIESKVKQELENINNDFFRVVKDDSEIKHGITLTREKPSDKKTQDLEENQKTEHQMFSRKRKMQGRDPCDIKLKIRVIEVVSERGRTIEEVERGFYESEEVKEQTEEVGEILDKQHDEMKVKDIGQGSISYTMSCQSLDALECLMRKYENGTLQDMMDNKFLSDNILDKIGAFHLAIDVTIDYEEYYLCRKELLKRHGLPLPKRQTYKIQPTISQMTGSTSRRVNRARYLLKSFEREGDKVTESQINTLDKLLQEKEEKRRIEQQQSVRESEKTAGRAESDSPRPGQHIQDDSELTPMTGVHLLSDDQIAEKNEELEAKVSNLTISGRVIRSWNRERGRGRDILKSVVVEGDRTEKAQLNPLLSKFAEVKTETQVLATNHPEVVMKTEKLSAYADHIVSDAEIPEETKEVYLDVRRVDKGHPVKGSVLEVFGSGSMPGQFNGANGIYIKNNGQWVICDWKNHRVQVIDPIQLCCDLILQFHAFPESFNPWNVTVDEDNDQYFMSD
ncbi:uncharacterized protein [Ptychodera flava]|uniref:uncharacterized protein n=1 Tax=Ptychodera flava TaxID=63121 RepID=UPI00396A7704